MLVGAGAIALSSATRKEQLQWKEAAQREGRRYGVPSEYVEARMAGRQLAGEPKSTRSLWDWSLVASATGIFIMFATKARVPQMSLHWGPAVALGAAMLVLLVVCGFTLWRTTRFN